MESFEATAVRSNALAQQVASSPEQFRVLTGERPTGPLHLGHYFGSITQRVELQRAGVETLLVIADYQVITDRDVMTNVQAITSPPGSTRSAQRFSPTQLCRLSTSCCYRS
jgi:tryptophanyl-tRNA synthetase